MELNKISYKFKISITLRDYNRALSFLESISSHIEELTSEDIELIRILKRGLLKKHSDYLKKIKGEFSKTNKFLYKKVLDDYSHTLHSQSLNTIENFINCVNSLFSKVKEDLSSAMLNVIRAKCFVFLGEYNEEEKSKYLQIAYVNYKRAVEICIKMRKSICIDKGTENNMYMCNNYGSDINSVTNRLKIFYSYSKFLSNSMNDKYRSVLFCINVIDEIHSIKNDEEQIEVEIQMRKLHKSKMEKLSNENYNDDDDAGNIFNNNDDDYFFVSKTSEFEKIETKFRLFYEKNLEDYNKVIKLYHPEYK